MTITFSLFVLQFTLLISIKSGDPAHLGELLGAWKPGVPTQGKACLGICRFDHRFPPSLPLPSVSIFISSISCFLFLFFPSCPISPFVCSSFFLSHPCLLPLALSSLSLTLLSLLCFFPCLLSLLSPPTDMQRHTQTLHMEKAESNCRRCRRSFPL